VRDYVMRRYELLPQNTGLMSLADDAVGNPGGTTAWDGVAITLFLDRDELQFPDPKAGSR